MEPQIGVLVVHGIGVQKPDFADDFIAEMKDRLGNPATHIQWEPAFWADLLTPLEDELWQKLSRNNDLDWITVRKFIINILADAVAYRRGRPSDERDMYGQIHARIQDCLAKLLASLGNPNSPLIVIAHSLGSVIMSDHIWDEQHGKEPGKGLGTNAFERMETLAGLATFGSNIPLFTLGLPHIVAIEFPPATLPDKLKAAARWLNFFDADDVLGFPLKPLSPSYAETVNEDLLINAGGLFTSWIRFPILSTGQTTISPNQLPNSFAMSLRQIVKNPGWRQLVG